MKALNTANILNLATNGMIEAATSEFTDSLRDIGVTYHKIVQPLSDGFQPFSDILKMLSAEEEGTELVNDFPKLMKELPIIANSSPKVFKDGVVIAYQRYKEEYKDNARNDVLMGYNWIYCLGHSANTGLEFLSKVQTERDNYTRVISGEDIISKL